MLLNLSNPEADLDIYLQVLREADPAEDGQAVHHLLPDLDLGLLHRQDLTPPFISYFSLTCSGLIPFLILVYLNIRILISLRNLRSRLNVRYHTENNPVKGIVDCRLFPQYSISWTISEKFREMRANQQSRDLNLAIVLISSVLMFLCCHTPRSVLSLCILSAFSLITLPRLITSIYEAANIHSILHCRDKSKDKTPLWFMYITATVQFLMVNPCRETQNLILFPGGECILQSANLLLRWESFQGEHPAVGEELHSSFHLEILHVR